MLNRKLLAVGSAFLLFSSLSAVANTLAVGDAIYKVPSYATTDGLRIFSKPGVHGDIVVTIPRSSSWIKKQGLPEMGWQRVSWNSQRGWVRTGTLEIDRAASSIKGGKTDCLHDPEVENKMCCGIVETTDDPSELVKIYSVTGVARGQLLSIKSSPGLNKRAVSQVPHNATWVMKLDQKKRRNGVQWEKVKWGGKVGWIESNKIQYTPELTAVNDAKRKECNKPRGCEPDLSSIDGKQG